MDFLHLVILGLIQGLTEFLPISSSAHLILLPLLSGWEDQGIVYDVAVHTGSLGAVIWYFHRDLRVMLRGWLASFSAKAEDRDYLVWYLLVGTFPVGLCGLLLHDFVSTTLRNPYIIACTSIGFGLVLLWADRSGSRSRQLGDLGWRDAVLVGLAQALALVPGTSRSGITITAGLMLGMDRYTASRFSFLLAIPVILLATGYETYKMISMPVTVEWAPVLTVMLLASVSAWLAIHYFLKLLDRTGMLPYVIYRVVLGVLLLVIYL